MKTNEHPFAFAIIDGGQHWIVEPTLPDLVDAAINLGVYAADFAIHPLYRKQGQKIAPEVPQTLYAYKDADGAWQWRELENITTLALSRYYVPTPDMVQHITDQFPEQFFIYTIDDPMLLGLHIKMWAGKSYHTQHTEVGMMLAQLFPHHDIQYTRVHENCVEYRIAVVSSAGGRELREKK